MNEVVNLIFKSADKLANLSTSAILSLLVIVQFIYIWKKFQSENIASENWRTTRELGIRAEEHQTTAVISMAGQIAKLGEAHNDLITVVSQLSTMVNERLPRR